MDRQATREDLDIPAPTYRVPAKRRLMDMDTRRLALVAGFFACGVALVVSVWTALSGGRSGPVPVITADGRPLKIRPENPGGMQTAGQNDDIIAAGRGAGQLAPPPEAPAPQALRQRQAAEEAARLEAARLAALPPQPQQVAMAPAVPPALPIPSVTAQPPARGAAASPPGANPATAAATPARAASAPAASAPAGPAPGGKATVQLAALATEQAAKQEWQRLAKKMPDVLGGHQPLVTRTERDGKTYYRLRTGGFADQSQATAFCDRVKAKGASCSVAPS